jgi:hypothetical protein
MPALSDKELASVLDERKGSLEELDIGSDLELQTFLKIGECQKLSFLSFRKRLSHPLDMLTKLKHLKELHIVFSSQALSNNTLPILEPQSLRDLVTLKVTFSDMGSDVLAVSEANSFFMVFAKACSNLKNLTLSAGQNSTISADASYIFINLCSNLV